jgi:hypothetical protein
VDAAAVTAIVAVGVTGVVGVTAAVVPAAVRRGDRKHERQMKIDDARAKAYASVLDFVQYIEGVMTRGIVDTSKDRSVDAGIQLWLWGSAEVRKLFFDWLKIGHIEWEPGAADAEAVVARALKAANAVRRRMGDELQGRV